MKKLAMILLAVLVIGPFVRIGTYAQAAEPMRKVSVYFISMQYTFNGQRLAPPSDQQGFIYHNHAYVPLRFISNALDKNVAWDNASSTVTVSVPSAVQQQQIQQVNAKRKVEAKDSSSVAAAAKISTSIQADFRPVHYRFDGRAVASSAAEPGFMYKDHLYVPLRFFSDAVGQAIHWDPATYSIQVNAKQSATDNSSSSDASQPNASAAGGSGSAATDITYDAIVKSYDTQIASLKNSAKAYFMKLAGEYLNAKDDATKQKIAVEAKAKLKQYDQQFATLMSSLKSKLTENGYSTSVVTQDEQQYQQEKAAAMKLMNSMISP